jgi:hypothetical protein
VWNGDPRRTVNEIWHALQACKTGLCSSLADSIHQQVDRHVYIAGLSGF